MVTLTLCVQKLTQDGMAEITKIPGISNPADLGAKYTLTDDHFDEHWRDVIVTFVTEGLESRCEQKRSRNHEISSMQSQPGHNNVEHSCGQDCTTLFTE